MNLAALSHAAAADKYKLASTTPWLLLVDFNWQGQHLRFVRNTDAVTFDAGDGAGPQTYQPLAFELVGAQTGTDGSLPQISLKISNVARMVEGALVQYQGGVGATANIYVLNTDNPAGEPELALQTTILKTTTSPAWVTFTLSAASPLRMLFPKYLYYQGTCKWQYKSVQCQYSGALVTCDLSFDGANGCIAHGNQLRYGGYPGIGSNGASVAGQI
jgi:phage-related protein